jgi:hypothetical protein
MVGDARSDLREIPETFFAKGRSRQTTRSMPDREVGRVNSSNFLGSRTVGVVATQNLEIK